MTRPIQPKFMFVVDKKIKQNELVKCARHKTNQVPG